MARYFHPGMELQRDPSLPPNQSAMIGGHIEKGQEDCPPGMIRVPSHFGGGLRPLPPGAIAFGFPGDQYRILGKGDYVDLPDYIDSSVVKQAVPQLITKEEAVAIGMANEDGTLKTPLKGSDKATHPTHKKE